MANLNLQEMRKWDSDTLSKKVDDLRVELFKIKMGASTTGIEKPHRIKSLKRDIARSLTVQNEKGRE